MANVDRHIAVQAGWIAGPAFGVAMMAAPEYLHLGPPASAIAFWGGIAVFLCTIFVVVFVSLHEENRRKRVTGPIIIMAIGALTFCGGAAWYFWPQQAETRVAAPPPLVEVLTPRDLPVLSVVVEPKYGLYLGNISCDPMDRPTAKWSVSVSVPGSNVSKYNEFRPETDQGNLIFESELQDAGVLQGVSGQHVVHLWIKPRAENGFVASNPKMHLIFRASNGQSFRQEIPIQFINLPR